MNPYQPLLLSLLELDAGMLDSKSADRLRSQIQTDPATSQKWNALLSALENRWQEYPVSEFNGVPTISPHRIAAFLENRLDQERMERIESALWQHPRLLQSVAELFQLNQSPVEDAAVNPALTDRLIRIGNRGADKDESESTLAIGEIRVEPKTGTGAIRSKNESRSTWASGLMVAATIIGVAIAGTTLLLWYQAGSRASRLAGGENENAIVQDKGAVPIEDNLDSPISPQNTTPETNAPQIADDPIRPSENQQPGLPSIDGIPQPEKMASDEPASTPERIANDDSSVVPIVDPAEPLPAVLAVQWEETEGLVAVRNSGEENWSGIQASSFVPRNGMTSLVFPGSLARIHLESIGTLNLAPNTLATWRVNAARKIVEIDLEQGGVLLAGAPAGTTFRVDDGVKKWSIEIVDEKSEVGVDGETGLDEAATRLFVNGGTVLVDGTELKRRQQIVWVSKQRNSTARFSQAPDWVRGKKDDSFKIPKEFVEQLIASEDMVGEVRRILAGDQAELQDVARFCLASIEPQAFENAFLANHDPRIRQQGILWLMQFQDSQQGLRKIAVQFARTYQAPEIGRALPRIVFALRSNRKPAYADAEQLVTGLNHAEPQVRQLASDLLDRVFGTRVPYQANAAPALRERAANAWQSFVDEAYGRPPNRRREP